MAAKPGDEYSSAGAEARNAARSEVKARSFFVSLPPIQPSGTAAVDEGREDAELQHAAAR